MIAFQVNGTPVPQPSNQDLEESYTRLKSVWRVAKEFGLRGQTVHKRLVRFRGRRLGSNELTEYEKRRIMELYNDGFVRGDGKLNALVSELGRSKQTVCRWARQHGFTSMHRKMSEDLASENSRRVSFAWKNGRHPKGMLGKKHSDKTKKLISILGTGRKRSQASLLKAAKTRHANNTMYTPRTNATWKAAWREVGGRRIFFRSRWEANYARFLEHLKTSGEVSKWEHEPETFWFNGVKRGAVSYLPDFKVVFPCGRIEYHEVKGWMDARSKTKIRRMAKYHPNVALKVMDSAWYKANCRHLASVVPGWE